MRIILALLCMMCVVPLSSYGESLPEPTKSKFLVSSHASFELRKGGRGTYYAMSYDIRETLPAMVYVVALFDNPEDQSKPLKVELVVDGGDKNFHVESPLIYTITNHRRYKARLTLYGDADHTHMLGTHDQDVLFDVPPQLAREITDHYGVTVLQE